MKEKNEIYGGEALFADGFEGALIGIGQQFNADVAVYDWDKCVEILMTRDGMTHEEALEHMDFNVTGSWVGKHTPVFLHFHVED
jgi:hypothetical protein